MELLTSDPFSRIERAAYVSHQLKLQAENVEADGWINAARYMREAAGFLEDIVNDVLFTP